jgi:hypothetical protein
MHLTNYAINKFSPDFQATDTETGHKRSIVSVFGELRRKGIDVVQLWKEIDVRDQPDYDSVIGW